MTMHTCCGYIAACELVQHQGLYHSLLSCILALLLVPTTAAAEYEQVILLPQRQLQALPGTLLLLQYSHCACWASVQAPSAA